MIKVNRRTLPLIESKDKASIAVLRCEQHSLVDLGLGFLDDVIYLQVQVCDKYLLWDY
jgi:hypothetical protein